MSKKAKDPAFLWYPGDWLGGTMTFTRHQKGAYVDLLMAQFNSRRLSIDDIKQILGDKDFAEIWESKLLPKFAQDKNGLFYNERLDKEIIKREKYKQNRLENLSNEK